jgi:hypothetical protein
MASWVIPTLPFNLLVEQQAVSYPVYSLINYASQHSNLNEPTTAEVLINTKPNIISNVNIAFVIFCFISLHFLLVLLASFFKIYTLKKKYKAHKLDSCTIYITKEKYTPYSFLDLIFWNQNIALDSKLGKQILEHELVHIKEKHSWDKIFIQVNLIAGCFNPFFWIIKSELEMIHEFIADKKSIPNGDVSEFANMILSVNLVNKNLPLTNPFFFSPIKRRLTMLTKKKSAKFSYIQRVLSLPVLIFLVVLLSLKSKQSFAQQIQNLLTKPALQKETTPAANIKGAKHFNSPSKKEPSDGKVNTTTVDTKLPKDTIVETIDELQKHYQAMELQYKKETAIARERKKMMELIQKQKLSEEQMIQVFKIVVKADTELEDKSLQKQALQEVADIIGKEKFKTFWKEKNQINRETAMFLNN